MIMIPIVCPVCSSTLVREKDQLFCRNSNCEAKSSKQLLHFVKTMKIKGLGEKTLEKLPVESINDIYDLPVDELIHQLGEKVGNKLYNEINSSKLTPLSRFIAAFGIDLIGNSASEKIANVVKSLWDITPSLCKEAGLGDKATNSLVTWITDNKELYKVLPITFIETSNTKPDTTLYNVVITEKLDDFSSRTKAKEYLEPLGISVLNTLSSKVHYLICDVDSASSSYQKAVKLNIPVITMNDLLNILKET